MQDSAKRAQISAERWSGSRLYSLWKDHPRRRSGEEITLRLEPESVMQDYSDLQWKPWLTACIRAYYNSGNIRIPEECVGSDILLALEYFGILTSSPDTFIFESPQALDRIKAWSSYFTHRMSIANWVISEYKTRLGGSRKWVTTPNPDEGNHAETLLQVNGGTATILGGDTSQRSNNSYEYMPSCQVIHYIFFENDATNRLTKETPMKMRRDFCAFLRRMMEPLATSVSFEIERVKITKSSGNVSTALRAVLRVEVDKTKRPKSHEQDVRQSVESNAREAEKHMDAPYRTSPPSIATTNESSENGKPIFEPVAPTNDRSESYGSDSEILQVTRANYSGSHLTRYSPYGDGNEDELMDSQPQLKSILKNDRIEEQRHPSRSTPIPEGKRTSPDEYFKIGAEKTQQRKQSISDNDFLQNIDNSVPIGYINTAFGDLQSVTSALSDPVIDDLTAGSFSNRLKLQATQRRALQQEDDTEPMQPRSFPSDSIEPDWSLRPLDSSATPPRPQFKPGGAFRVPQKPPEQVQPKSELTAEGCSFWDTFIANVCESVSTNPPPKNSSSDSPSDTMTPTGNRGDWKESNMTTDVNDEMDRRHAQTGIECRENRPYDQDEPTRGWGNSSFSTDYPANRLDGSAHDNILAALSHESSVVGAAKSMGKSLSNHIDGLVKMAFDGSRDETEPRGKLANHDKSHGVTRPPRSRQNSSPSTGNAIDAPRCHDQGSRKQSTSRHSIASSPYDERLELQNSDVIASKNRRRSDIHAAKTSMIPVSKMIDRSQLPPREPRRARVNEQKMGIARKKLSTSSSSFSNDVLIQAQTSQSMKSTISKAKVRTESSPVILRSRSSSTIASLEY